MTRAKVKHLPEQHDQKSHNPYKDRPEQVRAVPTNTGRARDERSPLEDVHHYLRSDNPVGKEVKERMLKNGTVKRTEVARYEFRDSLTGKVVTNSAVLDRIKKLIPPASFEGKISADPLSDLEVTWKDSKNRLHRKYNKAHDQASAAEKFERAKQFNDKLKKLRRQVNVDLKSENNRVRDAAAIIYLIDKTGFRAGSGAETFAEDKAYGAATLLGKHVKVDGNKVTFDYIGKKGVRIKKSVSDADLAEIINERKTSKWSDPLFKATATNALGYMKQVIGKDFLLKDFRNWHATRIALFEIKKKKGPASTEAKFAQWQKQVGLKVSKFLGNTPGVAIGEYIDYHVWEAWRKPEWGIWKPKKLKAMYVESWE